MRYPNSVLSTVTALLAARNRCVFDDATADGAGTGGRCRHCRPRAGHAARGPEHLCAARRRCRRSRCGSTWGYVWENEDFQTARRDAASVSGVKKVVTDMELLRGGVSGTSR